MSGRPPAVSVVHLVWKPLGPAPLERFVEAYREHDAGVPHELVVVYNGFADAAERAPFERLVAEVAHRPLVLPEPVQDLPAYHAAAGTAACPYVCFLNSYSEPLAAGWLAKLHAHAVRPEVGLVGASGSWESHHTLASSTLTELHESGPLGAARRALRELRRGRSLASMISSYLWMRRFVADQQYDPFPNHHVRTNGFMLRRDLMLALRWPEIRTKLDAVAFESGRDGLTRQVEARGLGVLVVGRDGEGYAPADWWSCGTYRSGDQQNLLIADNRTRQFGPFEELDAEAKRGIYARTWGPDPAAAARKLPGAGALAGP